MLQTHRTPHEPPRKPGGSELFSPKTAANECSTTSAGVLRVLVVCVCTALVPLAERPIGWSVG